MHACTEKTPLSQQEGGGNEEEEVQEGLHRNPTPFLNDSTQALMSSHGIHAQLEVKPANHIAMSRPHSETEDGKFHRTPSSQESHASETVPNKFAQTCPYDASMNTATLGGAANHTPRTSSGTMSMNIEARRDNHSAVAMLIHDDARMEVNAPPVSIKFVDVTYSVSTKRSSSLLAWRNGEMSAAGTKTILHGISGDVLPGELLALMGPSGSGKTTLINLLSGRKNAGTGTIRYNGVAYSKALKKRMGFVMQDDILHPHLTVMETLQYTALLRLPRHLSKTEKIRRAKEVMSQLGLERCQNTVIGGPFLHGISGGERKRVSVGNEILTNPSLLFLDEPTSGLDSTTALRIIHILHDLSKVGRSVITTIHQPSSRLFYMFDKLILLSEGRIVYLGKASTAMDYFSSLQLCPLIAMNPADFLLDLANGNLADISVPMELQRVSFQSDKKMTSTELQPRARQYLINMYEQILRPAVESMEFLELCPLKNGTSAQREWNCAWRLQLKYLFIRGFKARRHEYLSWLRIVQVIASSLIVGSLWLHSSSNTYKELADQIGLLFFISTFWTFFPLFTAIFAFPQERAILAKERASDMYRLSAYFLARTLSDVLLDLGLPIVFLIIVYSMATLQRSAEAFFLTLLTMFLSIIAAQGLGVAIGAAMMDMKKATSLASVILLAFMLAGGFFVEHLPTFIAWVRHISLNSYSFKLLVKVQYRKGQPYNCQSTLGCENIALSPALHGIPLGGGAEEALILIAMTLVYHLLAYCFLSRMKLGV